MTAKSSVLEGAAEGLKKQASALNISAPFVHQPEGQTVQQPVAQATWRVYGHQRIVQQAVGQGYGTPLNVKFSG